MSGFRIRMAVDTPVVMNDLLHLDGLLGYAVTARGGLIDEIPLDRRDGVFKASAALLETGPFGAVEDKIPRIRSLRGGDLVETLAQGLPSASRSIGAMSPMRPRLTSHIAISAVSAIWFSGCGRIDEIRDLLGDIRSVGGLHTVGYGRVTGVEIEEVEETDLLGLRLSSGLPARVVPVDLWRAWTNTTIDGRAVIADARWMPPYWDGARAVCVAPIRADLTGTRREVRSLLNSPRS